LNSKSFSFKVSLPVILLLILLGCSAHSPHNRTFVSTSIKDRVGYGIPNEAQIDTIKIPNDVTLDDGITEEEAVAIALWNNAQFQVDIMALGFARADLIEAGLFHNPIFSLLFPVGPKQLEAALNLPIEVLWQRPNRVAAAKLNSEKVAENLIQHGLALVRDVNVAFADLSLAQERAKIIADEVILRNDIAKIAAARLRAGDISELEETAIRLIASQAREAAIRYIRDAKIETIRLKTLLGLISENVDFQFQTSPNQMISTLDSARLIKTALAARPDLRAAELAIEVAGKRLGWERSKIFNLTAVLDANGEGKEGFEMGPGVQLAVPIFNWNNGGTSRAHAEMEQAAKQYIAVQHSIIKEVLESYENYRAAQKLYEILREEIVPAASRAVRNGEKAYLVGEISYLEFLEFKRQLLDSRFRLAEAEAELRRSIANLHYSTGSKDI